MTFRRLVAALVTGVLATSLAACAGLPMSGSVNPGLDVEDEAANPDFAFLPDRPQAGATPEQIVDGFLRAGSGTNDDWATAKLFLTTAFREEWAPDAGVTVDAPGQRDITETGDGAVTATITPEAVIDGDGQYQTLDTGESSLGFELEQEDGQWRISAAPDGIVLDRNVFPRVYHRYPLMFFDPSWQYLVPDVRWFPTTNAPARIAQELVDGAPSAWLAESVKTSFPDSVSLASPAVPVDGGIAQVSLTQGALSLDAESLDRMQTQLTASMQTASVAAVQMSVPTQVLDADTVSTRSTRISGAPLVVIDGVLGFSTGSQLTPIEGLSDAMETVEPAAVQVSADRETAAVLLTDGRAARVGADGTLAVVDERAGLVAPSIDPLDYVWTVPRGEPTAVVAHSADGIALEVGEAWPGAVQVTAMLVSRDGTRLIAALRGGESSWVAAAGIVRDDTGAPVRLGEPVVLGELPGAGVGLAWLDDATLAVLSSDDSGPVVVEQIVGGTQSSSDAPAGAVAIAGSTSAASLRLLDDQGNVSVKRGVTWTTVVDDVEVLASQQGSPE
ncbi:LpqB family beta-propeller domain-containing protein [Microbacterium fluvii]|uniref:LpqB family beta-propeller domain-containing protein n=1 Tax=Microbacterium fluvii TaxID=415215 RepID=A0ABW2H916_9MICO|nr:LpqB family beta-propeller domain-containing protein [Microbacterium fluvii]MCU4671458.1 LpqB family beta-propeller domain-containing protein [Microbacterium fluvii]